MTNGEEQVPHKVNETCKVRLESLEVGQKDLKDGQMLLEEQVSVLNRAMFGEKLTKQKGVVDMTAEMYEVIMAAKGSRTVLILIASVIGASTTVFLFVKKFF